MEVESTISSLRTSLVGNPCIIHKKALAILETVLKAIHAQLQSQSEDNANLIVFTLLYKQYKQSAETLNL